MQTFAVINRNRYIIDIIRAVNVYNAIRRMRKEQKYTGEISLERCIIPKEYGRFIKKYAPGLIFTNNDYPGVEYEFKGVLLGALRSGDKFTMSFRMSKGVAKGIVCLELDTVNATLNAKQ